MSNGEGMIHSSAGAKSSMDALIEEEIQGLELNDDAGDDYEDDINDPAFQLQNLDLKDLDEDFGDGEMPPELNEYLNKLEYQTKQLEQELLLCDEVLNESEEKTVAGEKSNALVVYDDVKLIHEAAAEAGMTVEDFTQKVLKEVAEDEFTEDKLVQEYDEFIQLQKEFADLQAGMEETLRATHDSDILLAIEAPAENTELLKSKSDVDVNSLASSDLVDNYRNKHGFLSHDQRGDQLVSINALSCMREFIQEQLRKTDEAFQSRQQILLQSIESHRQEEEKQLLAEEERKKALQHQMETQQAMLMEREKERQGKLEEELKAMQDEVKEELNYHQVKIDQLTKDLENEKIQYQAIRTHWMMSLEETRYKAATEIQRIYRGYRSRKLNFSTIQKFEELKVVRKKERFNLRVLEVEYEMKYKAEQEKKKKEEEETEKRKKQEDEEKQKQLEMKRLEEEKRALERKKEEEKLEEERKKKEDEKKKEAERQRKEEERLRKLEEKRIKEEEKKRLKEEDRLRKEEEKTKKEEERKKKEEEKKMKEEAERKRKEEEKQKQEEEKRKAEEERKKKIEEEERKKKLQSEEKKGSGEGIRKPHVKVTSPEPINLNVNNNMIDSDEYVEDLMNVTLTPHPPACPPPRAPISSWLPASDQEAPDWEHPPASVAPVVVVTAPPPPGPDPLEVLRLAWMKSCIPWSKVSNEPWKLVQSTKNIQKRPVSAKKKFPPVAEAVVLSAAHVETLRQVSSVALCDLPGCSLSTLSQCWSLKYLTITHCNLVCLDCLASCKHLLYINAEYNAIEFVDLKDLGSIQVVKLANNKLSAIHGFDGCINLRWLDLSQNNITKIGGLASLRRLHTLNLSYNQVISTESIEKVVTLQELDLSHNFLRQLSDVEKLCLLTRLDLSSNNLLEVPELKNQVLLQVVQLQKNSIRSLEALKKFWLPLLHTLSLSENMLESIDGLDHLIMLKHLDVSGNQITESDNLIQVLKSIRQLETLDLDGNPVVEVDKSGTSLLLSELRFLQSFNGEDLHSDARMDDVKMNNSAVNGSNPEFFNMCADQIQLHTTLRRDMENQMKSYLASLKVSNELICQAHFYYCEASFKMASEHRSAHEYGCIEAPVTITIGLRDATSPAGEILNSVNKANLILNINNADAVSTNTSSSIIGKKELKSSVPDFETTEKLAKNEKDKKKKANSITANKMAPSKNAIQKSGKKPKDDYSMFSDDSDSSCDYLTTQSSHLSHKPPPVVTSYINEKDKFNLALAGSLGQNLPGGNVNNSSHENEALGTQSQISISSSLQPMNVSVNHRDLFESALEKQSLAAGGGGSTQASTKSVSHPQNLGADNSRQLLGVKANVVVDQLKEDEKKNWLNEIDLDQIVNIESSSFDIDKYLEMDIELDDFLEMGWRPSDEPQITYSAYPVLRKIQPNNNRAEGATPPCEPVQAWKDGSHQADNKGRNPQLPNSHGAITPHPSPVPSSVASAAETIESSRAKAKMDEILHDWGFKDAHTAELMMARAKKMKYNAERKRKLSKLDPKQRLLLFRKLEESGKIVSVRPPNVKTLPRKEYFQAREDEIIQQQLQRQAEDSTKISRTYEWIHTQVGDYPISSSRINPGLANFDSSQDNKTPKTDKLFDTRKTSPLSDHKTAVAGRAVESQNRRLSFGDENSNRSPLLPPIHKQDRISFRDSPVDKSAGWGGGKKRGQKL